MAIATQEHTVVEKVQKKLYIGGEWRDATGGGTLEVIDPSTEEAICEVADATPEDAKAALDAAVEKQAEWAATPANDRAGILWKAFELMTERADELALLMTLEMGKSVTESKGEITYAADFFRWYSGEALRFDGNYKQFANGTSRVLVMSQPVGPSLMITPWNFPMAMGTRKIGPAIAAGCTVVIKPAKQTPLSMLALGQILEEAGLPGGVVNMFTTSSSGATTGPLIADDRLRKLSFTGSTEVGRGLIEASAQNVLKVSMELGGNAPFLVFEDADLDEAVEGAVLAKMRNIGEACTAANRFHVAEPIREEFTRRLAEKMGKLEMGRGTEEGAQVGPLIDEPSRQKVADLVQDAIDKGAKLVIGGEIPDGPGFFYPPTILADVPNDARVFSEEIFGPVAPIGGFETEEEAIALANNTEYGLVGYIFTRDIKRAIRVCEGLETGMVGLNQGMVSNAGAPFGGVKQSGIGREGGHDGLQEFLETKYVAVNL
ncbi:MAG: succinate-semialdehyde dehydrogenase / glutarate-semialdehyde dehydrogenase [Thermoleophilaceae bacterium]|jgi:succinate-semialdehyde dehydrogenase/glutarate-semialdehyde dehydrogenase|nr:succinate-semialdehyde dehydrogenase / glutarate-semialdehyde dehydrogenase [Thermoleophilaceae bacterium]